MSEALTFTLYVNFFLSLTTVPSDKIDVRKCAGSVAVSIHYDVTVVWIVSNFLRFLENLVHAQTVDTYQALSSPPTKSLTTLQAKKKKNDELSAGGQTSLFSNY